AGHPTAAGERPIGTVAGRSVSVSNPERRPRSGHHPARRSGRRSFRKGELMLDDLKEEEIVNKVGGRFKLSTLIQKRMVALNTGARPLVDSRSSDKMSIVVQEIM